jgi:hypothetical protein
MGAVAMDKKLVLAAEAAARNQLAIGMAAVTAGVMEAAVEVETEQSRTPHETGEACRLYVLLARKSDVAVILRRGPGKNTLLLTWDRKRDSFTPGQWIKHKIYERRCDLSPDGEYLIYFAAKFKAPLYSWTAISKPPWFSALALWQKNDTWGGGGLLDDKRVVTLNHRAEHLEADPKQQPHPKWRIIRDDGWCGKGEDYPVELVRLMRDGWTIVQDGMAAFNAGRKAQAFVTYDPPEILELKNPKSKSLVLRRVRTRALIRQGKHYDETFEVAKAGHVFRRFAYFDWARWDHTGDLLLANAGKIWRVPHRCLTDRCEDVFENARELCDLTDLKFKAETAPGWAKT